MRRNHWWYDIVSTNILPCMSFLNLPTYCAHALSLALAHNACPLVQASNNESAPLNKKTTSGQIN